MAASALLFRQHERVEFGGRPELNALLEIRTSARARRRSTSGLADLPRLAAASDDAVLAVLRQLPHSREGAKGLPRIAKAIVKDAKRVAKRAHEISDEIAHGVHAGDGGAPPLPSSRRAAAAPAPAGRSATRRWRCRGEPAQRHDWSTFLRLAAEAPVVGFAAGGGATAPSASPSPSRSIAARRLCGGCRSATPRRTTTAATRRSRVCGACWAGGAEGVLGGDAHVEAIVAAGVAVSPPVYDPMHAAALLQPHIDPPPKLSELLTLIGDARCPCALRRRADGARERGVHAARSLAVL